MNDTLIERWNSKVGSNDMVFHLGDFCFGRDANTKDVLDIIHSLNGKIYLIPGNHDKIALECANIISQTSSSGKSKMVVLPELYTYYHQDTNVPKGRRMIVMCHYAMRVWCSSHRGESWHLYGHSHGTLPDAPNSLSMDVGVDVNNFYPFSYEDITGIMDKKNYIPLVQGKNKSSYEETKKYYENNM